MTMSSVEPVEDDPVVFGADDTGTSGIKEDSGVQIEKTGGAGKLKKVFHKRSFQFLLILSLIRLIVYLNKIYQDTNAISVYFSGSDILFSMISASAVIMPPLTYAIFLTSKCFIASITSSSVIKSTSSSSKDVDAVADVEKETSSPDTSPSTGDIMTRVINGLLLIPWQIKRHLDLLYFTSQRVCDWRSADEMETGQMIEMEREAEILEFFEDFFAGFIQILLQIYILIGSFSIDFWHDKSCEDFLR